MQAVTDLGYEKPTPVQEQAIPLVLAGRDLMAGAQTGTGKTAAFALPILQRFAPQASTSTSPARHPVRALVLTPTRELAVQVYESFRDYGKHLPLRSTVVYGGVDMNAQIAELRRGVEVLLDTKLVSATCKTAELEGGVAIRTRTLVSTVPSSPHPLIEALALPKTKNGRLLVDRGLAVEGRNDIWALGDCAMVPDPNGGFAPPTAQHAIRQARVAAANIVAGIRGGLRSEYAFKGLGKMGALGHRCAVAELFGLQFSGFIAWWLWRTIYLMKLPGWGRRLKVASSWTLDLFLPTELVQLKVGRTERAPERERVASAA